MIELFLYHWSAAAMTLAKAAKGNAITCVFVVWLAYLAFNLLEGHVEQLIWGERFRHWLDLLFIVAFIEFGGHSVYACAIHNTPDA